jgi:hypothetical protein
VEDARLLAEEAGIPWSGLAFEELREQLRAHYSSQKNHSPNPEEAEPPDQHPTEQHCTPHEKTIQKSGSLGRLFAAVDGDGDGDLDRAEVAALLRRERLDASDAHVDGIFDRCVRDAM